MMTYGYNAKFVNYTSTQDLYSIASKLLSELVDVRRTPEVTRTVPCKLTLHTDCLEAKKTSNSFHLPQSGRYSSEKGAWFDGRPDLAQELTSEQCRHYCCTVRIHSRNSCSNPHTA